MFFLIKRQKTWFRPEKPGLNQKDNVFLNKRQKTWFRPEKPGLNQKNNV